MMDDPLLYVLHACLVGVIALCWWGCQTYKFCLACKRERPHKRSRSFQPKDGTLFYCDFCGHEMVEK